MAKPPTEWNDCETFTSRECECRTCSPQLYQPLFPDIEEPRVVPIEKARKRA